MVLLDKILRRNQVGESVWFGDLKIASLLCVDDVVYWLHQTMTFNIDWASLQLSVKLLE